MPNLIPTTRGSDTHRHKHTVQKPQCVMHTTTFKSRWLWIMIALFKGVDSYLQMANKSMLCFDFGLGLEGDMNEHVVKKKKKTDSIAWSNTQVHICDLLPSYFCRKPASREVQRLNPSALSALARLSCQPPSRDSSWFLPLPNVQAHLRHSHLHPSGF